MEFLILDFFYQVVYNNDMESISKLTIVDIQNLLNHQWEMQLKGNFSLPLVLNNFNFMELQEVLSTIKNKGLRVETWDLEEMVSSEFSGMPYLTEEKKTDYKSIFPEENTILLIENFSGYTDKDIKSSLHTIISERTINGHKIPLNILLVLRGNIDEYQMENMLDPATLDRLKIVMLGEES